MTEATETAKPRKRATRDEQLSALKAQQRALENRIRDLANQENAKKRKEETRLKVLAGAALLADLEHNMKENPATSMQRRGEVIALFNRAIQNKKDRDFLTSLGWL